MKVAVVKEAAPAERRVALVPEAVAKLRAAGLEVLVETGAGDRRLAGRRGLLRGRRERSGPATISWPRPMSC